jgi:L,D-transpeptidase ErfK/SrfK
MRTIAPGLAGGLLLSALALLASPADCAAAQRLPPGLHLPVHDSRPGEPVRKASLTGRHVRISLEEQRLYVMEGERVVWSALVGTGTGEVLEHADRSWHFSTPRGTFRVEAKERDPVWVLPEWVFVKRGEPVPPLESPKRTVAGSLGAAALYISPEIAIHGTDEPELLGGEVSHGCVRMSNEDVLRLYEEMEVGSPVVIF